MIRQFAYSLFAVCCFPLLVQAQDDESSARTTVVSTITVVPVAYSSTRSQSPSTSVEIEDNHRESTTFSPVFSYTWAGSSTASDSSVFPSESTTTEQPVFSILPYYPTQVSSSVDPDHSSPSTLIDLPGSTPTEPVAYAPSYPPAAAFHSPKPFYSNFTWPNITYSTNSSSTSRNETCSLFHPTCPACNNQTVTDSHNVTYVVQCGYKFDAALDFAFAEPLTANSCLARCDGRNVTCLGASWSTEECVLALGPIVGKIEDPGHLAFLRLGVPPPSNISYPTNPLPRPPISTRPSYLNMTRYDGGSLTRVPSPATTAIDFTVDTDIGVTTQTAVDSAETTPLGFSTHTQFGEGSLATMGNPLYTPGSETSTASSTALPSVSGRPPWGSPGYGGYDGSGIQPPAPLESSQGESNWPWWLQWGWWNKAWGGGGEDD